jgi:hypothetical protein
MQKIGIEEQSGVSTLFRLRQWFCKRRAAPQMPLDYLALRKTQKINWDNGNLGAKASLANQYKLGFPNLTAADVARREQMQ